MNNLGGYLFLQATRIIITCISLPFITIMWLKEKYK